MPKKIRCNSDEFVKRENLLPALADRNPSDRVDAVAVDWSEPDGNWYVHLMPVTEQVFKRAI